MNLYLDNLVFWKLYGILDMKLGKNIILKSKCYSLSKQNLYSGNICLSFHLSTKYSHFSIVFLDLCLICRYEQNKSAT